MDILGKSLGAPIYRLLGGKAQQKLRVYNTYTAGWTINHWQMGTDTEKIVRFLRDRGIKAIKFYPYDPISRRNGGTYISPSELDSALDSIKLIRDKFGDDMEIAIDINAQWNLTCALRIAHSLRTLQDHVAGRYAVPGQYGFLCGTRPGNFHSHHRERTVGHPLSVSRAAGK